MTASLTSPSLNQECNSRCRLNVRLDQHVSIKSNGLTEVRIRRHVHISRGISNSTVSFTLEYVPDRQFIQIRRAVLKRNGSNTIVPIETDESTNLPNARLYYDAQRRRIDLSGLKPEDVIELDWSVIDHSTDPELPAYPDGSFHCMRNGQQMNSKSVGKLRVEHSLLN